MYLYTTLLLPIDKLGHYRTPYQLEISGRFLNKEVSPWCWVSVGLYYLRHGGSRYGEMKSTVVKF